MLPGPMELVIILVIVAMLFGVGRLPEVFGAVGKGIREFRREVTPDANSTSMAASAKNTTDPTETTDTAQPSV